MPRIPDSASGDIISLLEDGGPSITEAYIANPYYSKETLTLSEAIDAINELSAMIKVDLKRREMYGA